MLVLTHLITSPQKQKQRRISVLVLQFSKCVPFRVHCPQELWGTRLQSATSDLTKSRVWCRASLWWPSRQPHGCMGAWLECNWESFTDSLFVTCGQPGSPPTAFCRARCFYCSRAKSRFRQCKVQAGKPEPRIWTHHFWTLRRTSKTSCPPPPCNSSVHLFSTSLCMCVCV